MASTANFLTIPLEIRYQVYSHLLVNGSVISVSAQYMDNPLRNGVVRACRQTFYEMIEYYYANNTLLLSLLDMPESTTKFLRHLSRVQHLQMEFGDLGFSPTSRAFFLPVHTQQRCDWFLKTFRQAKQGQEGKMLKSLVAFDRCGTSIVSESIPPTSQIWKDQIWRERKRREVLALALLPLCHVIDSITIESRAMSEERDQWGHLSVTFFAAVNVPSLTYRQPRFGTWSLVLAKLDHYREFGDSSHQGASTQAMRRRIVQFSHYWSRRAASKYLQL